MNVEEMVEDPQDFHDLIMGGADSDWPEVKRLAYVNALNYLAVNALVSGEQPIDHIDDLIASAQQMVEIADEEELNDLAYPEVSE